jgi:hypothetical protein
MAIWPDSPGCAGLLQGCSGVLLVCVYSSLQQSFCILSAVADC